MKSRIVNKSKKVLLTYGISNIDLKSLIEISNKYDMSVRQVFPNELNCKILNLVKSPQSVEEDYPQDTISCILIVGLEKNPMDRFLNDIKSKGLDIPLKAILTPTNQNWDFKTLLDNLILEHNQFNNR